jgi:hypothetical protein
MHDRATWAAAAAALSVGVATGFVGARGQLLARWAHGPQAITKAQHARSSSGDANPTPAVGDKVFASMPIGRMRQELAGLTSHDPLVVTVAAIGAGDDGYELHLVVENHGTCEAVSYAGVAYGFDAFGTAAPLNRAGEQYLAFRQDKTTSKPLAPNAKQTYAQKLLHCDAATLAVAHVDEVTCADGTSWRR